MGVERSIDVERLPGGDGTRAGEWLESTASAEGAGAGRGRKPDPFNVVRFAVSG